VADVSGHGVAAALFMARAIGLLRVLAMSITEPELLLRRALWAAGVRGWRLHPKRVPGRPDLAWLGLHVGVFVDGAFWHGHPDYYHGQSGAFWDEKIARNRARDERVNAELSDQGWRVVRLWDFEIQRATTTCVERVRAAVVDARNERAVGATDGNMCSLSVRPKT